MGLATFSNSGDPPKIKTRYAIRIVYSNVFFFFFFSNRLRRRMYSSTIIIKIYYQKHNIVFEILLLPLRKKKPADQTTQYYYRNQISDVIQYLIRNVERHQTRCGACSEYRLCYYYYVVFLISIVDFRDVQSN